MGRELLSSRGRGEVHGLRLAAWETYYDYAPARGIGGDYCDLVAADGGDLFFFFGDAVGKGIMGSMIASQLYALFRTLLSVGLPLNQLFDRGNRLFCESMATDYYATVVCGRASSTGAIELINAGHLPPLILRSGRAMPLAATGVPLGLFHTSTYEVTKIQLAPCETLLFYTDGITEARNPSDVEYGRERLARFVAERSDLSAEELIRTWVDDVTAFVANTELSDDRTLMALRRV
jgi:phosphoserine phosphatase RsbU/P